MEDRESRTTLRFDVMTSPIGDLTLYTHEDGALAAIDFGSRPVQANARRDVGACAAARRQLEEYFAGKRRTFTLALRPLGSPFQQQVWKALLEIPFGTTTSYGEIARRLGPGTSARAVGSANGANPIPIVIPCHRVIGANGSLTGYGGGISRKAKLLELENAGPVQGALRY